MLFETKSKVKEQGLFTWCEIKALRSLEPCGMDYECDGRTDGQTDRQNARVRSHIVRCALKNLRVLCTAFLVHVNILSAQKESKSLQLTTRHVFWA